MRLKLLFLILLLGTLGCAHKPSNLHFKYEASSLYRRGPLSSIRPLKISVLDFLDARSSKDVVGRKMNSLSAETGEIISKQSVPKMLQLALKDTLEKNGHRAKRRKPDVVLSATVTEFWVDMQIFSTEIEYTGAMTFVLDVMDRRYRTLYRHEYKNHYHEKKSSTVPASAQKELSEAVDQLMFQVVADRELYNVLNRL